MTADWNPILRTTEISPGVWEMKQVTDYVPFGIIELRRVGDDLCRYRVKLNGEVIGWSTTLMVACERLWKARIEQQEAGRRGPPNGQAG